MSDTDTQDTLADHLRTVLAGPDAHGDEAVAALRVLLDLGWVEPDRVEARLGREPAVRSLAEDLAVARLRARTAAERSRDLQRRTDAVLARAQELRRQTPPRAEAGGEADRVAALEREVAQLRTALENRPRIEHAVGIVMQLVGCDETLAWDLLSRLSQHTNVKVRVMADALASRVGDGHGVPADVAAGLRALAEQEWSGRSRT
ncbi:ANTAR domain-containing protein [Kineococcus endophyticus]|uniref:ANTAR domain-containing protein n=1 Tax=Kineococcus endophyticus TaxID=1181883 RepID=A0ABV3P945_9ACTN